MIAAKSVWKIYSSILSDIMIYLYPNSKFYMYPIFKDIKTIFGYIEEATIFLNTSVFNNPKTNAQRSLNNLLFFIIPTINNYLRALYAANLEQVIEHTYKLFLIFKNCHNTSYSTTILIHLLQLMHMKKTNHPVYTN